MAASNFGVGLLFTIPTGATPTPTFYGALNDVSVDFSFDWKQLYGSFQFALEQARGKGKIDIKASIGRFDPVLFNQIFFGQTTTTGEIRNSAREAATIPGTPYQVTVVNSATFQTDLGVYDTVAAKWLTRVASGPTTGQYSEASGVYTFAAADTTPAVQFYYTYTASATGTTLAFTNPLMGAGPQSSLYLVNQSPQTTKCFYLKFPAVLSSKLAIPMKLDDYTMASIDFGAQDDGSGNVFTMSMTG